MVCVWLNVRRERVNRRQKNFIERFVITGFAIERPRSLQLFFLINNEKQRNNSDVFRSLQKKV